MTIKNIHEQDDAKSTVQNNIRSSETGHILHHNLIRKTRKAVEQDEVDVIGYYQEVADLVELVANKLSERHNIIVESYPNGRIVAVIDDVFDFQVTHVKPHMITEEYELINNGLTSNVYEEYVNHIIFNAVTTISKQLSKHS